MFNSDPHWLKYVITGDETWVYGYDPETKRQSSQRLEPGELRFKKARMIKSKFKCLLITFFDVKGLSSKILSSSSATPVTRRSMGHLSIIAGIRGDPQWVRDGIPALGQQETEAGLDGNSKKVEVDHGRRQSDHGRHGCPTSRIGDFKEDALSQSRTFEWFARIKAGRTSVKNDLHTGRTLSIKKTRKCTQNQVIDQRNPRITIRELSEDLDISFGTCQTTIKNDLHLKRSPDKFVTHLLTNEQKEHLK
ncbi:hypothetical protein LAZ67_15002504 [Cordylochernes scorpioides]|uniref:Transposase n=1 Tax=Cordylochernes scorpioides TaxID=51811 RepID=A0ABY6L9L8_9ARAC|nr:hypothetical protein LAZ67_15002504 [Cordylochernes scorpioides]